jgi:hypothetical protein
LCSHVSREAGAAVHDEVTFLRMQKLTPEQQADRTTLLLVR